MSFEKKSAYGDFFDEFSQNTIESAGSFSLVANKNGKAFAVNNASGRSFPILSDNPIKQYNLNDNKWELIAAERNGGKNYAAWQHRKTGSINTKQFNNYWLLKKDLGTAKTGSKDYSESESLFLQNFDNDYNSLDKVNYWSPNSYWKFLWGYQQNGASGGANIVPAFQEWEAPIAENISSSARNIVAILDTGVRWTHEDLYQNIWINTKEIINNLDDDNNGFIDDRVGWDFAYADNSPTDVKGHGTHVAGTVAARANKVGVIGSNPIAKIMNLKVLNDQGSGNSSNIARASYYALLNGAKIINMSLGGESYNSAFYDILKAVQNHGSLIIAAAGNTATNNDIKPHYPASYNLPGIISVAASNTQGRKASFSNYGKVSVDLYAPGESIVSTFSSSNSSYARMSGTSMAAPLVSGALSAYWIRNQNATWPQVRHALYASVYKKPTYSNSSTGGILDMNQLFKTEVKSSYSGVSEATELPPNKEADTITKNTLKSFKNKDITETLFATLRESHKSNKHKGKLNQLVNQREGVFQHIESIETFPKLETSSILVDLSPKHNQSKTQVLGHLLDTVWFESFERDDIMQSIVSS